MREPTMTVKDMVSAYLRQNGYDGLWSPDGECACKRDDLMPCDGESIDKCRPGYLAPCPDDCGEHEFHIQERK